MKVKDSECASDDMKSNNSVSRVSKSRVGDFDNKSKISSLNNGLINFFDSNRLEKLKFKIA